MAEESNIVMPNGAKATGVVGKADALIEAQKERLDKKDEVEHASQIPQPTGYKILIALPEPETVTKGGIHKAAETLAIEEVGSVCGFVLKIGPDAYAGDKYPSGPWCAEGDWIMMRAYAGTRFKIHGKEFRLINDDSVEAVVADPTGIVKI